MILMIAFVLFLVGVTTLLLAISYANHVWFAAGMVVTLLSLAVLLTNTERTVIDCDLTDIEVMVNGDSYCRPREEIQLWIDQP